MSERQTPGAAPPITAEERREIERQRAKGVFYIPSGDWYCKVPILMSDLEGKTIEDLAFRALDQSLNRGGEAGL